MCRERGHAEVLTFDSRRYVGAQIGIFNPSGERVGKVSHVRNREHLVVAGERSEVRELVSSAPAAAAL
jgi:adenine-specific DNA-methyltransferase